MAYTQADLTRLERALANGTTSVEVDGQRISYRSLSEIREAISYVKEQLSAASAAPAVMVSYASHTRG